LFEKILGSPFSRHAWHAPQKFLSICDLLKFSRNSKIYTRCFCIVFVYLASTFEIENFDIPIFFENCSLFYLIKSILRS
jgi:hypothetical protein